MRERTVSSWPDLALNTLLRVHIVFKHCQPLLQEGNSTMRACMHFQLQAACQWPLHMQPGQMGRKEGSITSVPAA